MHQEHHAFLGEPGFRWDGLYDIPCMGDGIYRGDIRRVMWQGDHFSIRWHPDPEFETRLTRDELFGLDIRRVVGVANPFEPDFADFLRTRFTEVTS